MGVQLLGLFFVLGSQYGRIDDVAAARGLRAAIVLNAIVICTVFPFITYLAFCTV